MHKLFALILELKNLIFFYVYRPMETNQLSNIYIDLWVLYMIFII